MSGYAAADPTSSPSDVHGQLSDFHVTIPSIPLTAHGLELTEARNQMPTLLLFRDGILVDRRLGAQSIDDLRAWLAPATTSRQESFAAASVSRSRVLRSSDAQRPGMVPHPHNLKVELLLILIVSVAAIVYVVHKGQ